MRPELHLSSVETNVHHISWGAQRPNCRGINIIEAMDECGLFTLMNDGTPTHNQGGVLELTLHINELEVNATWSLNLNLQSNHTAIEFTFAGLSRPGRQV